jgi:hypothetical protein
MRRCFSTIQDVKTTRYSTVIITDDVA